MKKNILVLASLVLLCACNVNNGVSSSDSSINLSSGVSNSEPTTSSGEIPTDVNNFEFSKNNLGQLVLNEEGGITITKYNNKRGSTLDVVIPETYNFNNKTYNITRIANKAFVYAGGIESVTLSKNIRLCASDAFAACTSLLNIYVDEGSEYYSSNDGVLYSKDETILIASPNAKEDVVTPSSTKEISAFAFSNSRSKTITLNEGIEKIGNSAFASSRDIDTISIPNSVTTIGESLFELSRVKNVVLGTGISVLPSYTFFKCAEITNITIPGNVKSLQYSAISQNEYLRSVVLEEGVLDIGEYAISFHTNLSNISLPNGLQTIGNNAFISSPSLEHLVVPEGVISIGDGAFSHSSSLQTLSLPSTVETIGKGILQNCADFVNFSLADSNLNFELVDGVLFTEDLSRLVAFPQCYGTNEYVTYEVPSTVRTIDRYAFSFVLRVTKVILPSGLEEIGAGAFANGAVRNVEYLGSETDWENVTKVESLSLDGIEYQDVYWNDSANITLTFGE